MRAPWRERYLFGRIGICCAVALSVGCAPGRIGESGARRTVVDPPAGGSTALYSAGVRAGNLLFLSGVVGRSDRGDVQEATRDALDGVRERAAAIQVAMTDLVQCTVFLTDIEDYAQMNEAYVTYFPAEPPARTAIAVDAVPASGLLEIACIAAVP